MIVPGSANSMLLAGGGYQISRSVRLRSSASAYLNRTLTTPTAGTKFTWSGWVKRGVIGGSDQELFMAYTGSTNRSFFVLTSDTLGFYQYTSGTYPILLNTSTQLLRDPSAWYHIVCQYDSTQATASNRIRIYVNTAQVPFSGSPTYPSLNYVSDFNTATAHAIGRDIYNGASNFDGYLTEINFIDGQALTPSSFGENNTVTGVWQPKKYTGTYGTNGFYLNFSDNSAATAAAIGKDYSGNGNNWTPNNISVTSGSTYDSMIDVPTPWADGGNNRGNYCVLNSVSPNPSTTASTCSDGNLTASASAANTMRKATIGISTGVWYFEATLGSTIQGLGLGESAVNSFGTNSSTAGARTYYLYNASSNLYTILPGADTSITTTIGSGGTLAVAIDFTNKKLWLGYAASGGGSITWIGGGSPSAGTSPTHTIASDVTELFPLALTNGPSLYVNFGQRPFTYTVPTGFKALNTYNLPASTINNGAKYMAATLWTGNGTSQTISNAVNGVSMQPDMVWIKDRSSARSHILSDSVRGTSYSLYPNETTAEATSAARITAFNSNGFSIGDGLGVNASTETFVGWQWQAGQGTTSSNTSGTITSTVSVNATAGFSVVTWTNPASGSWTVGHGLGVAPKMIITKGRSSTNSWVTYHVSLGNTQAVLLNSTAAASTNSGYWGNTSPTSTVFTMGDASVIGASYTMVAYCWSEVAGFSKFGSYTGNGSADGPFVYCGFRPKFVMVKASSTTGGWVILDSSRNTYNVTNSALYPNLSNAETTDDPMDFLSNGFKFRTSGGDNASGQTYIYAAFAENPFSKALAR